MTWYIWVVIIMLYIIQIIAWQNIFEFSLSVIDITNHCMTKYIWVVNIMLYILQIIAWQNIFEFSLSYYKSLHDKIYLSCHYYVIQIKFAWQNIFELSLLCYTYYKSLHDKIYLSCHYYVIHTTNHCMTIYLSCHYYVIHNTNRCTKYIWVFIICYTYYKSLHDKIYLSCHYYVMHTTNHCMTWYIWVVIIMLYIIQIVAWQNIFEFSLSYILQIIACQNIFELSCMTKYIWVVIIMLYILQIIAWQNIFELSLLCYTYYKSLHDKIYLSCHYYVIHTTNHCMTKYIWVVIIMLYILQIIAWQNIFELSLSVIHTTNHCMTKYIWVVIIMLYIIQIIAWQNIFELSLLCYTYYKSLHDKIYLSCHYYVMHTTNHCMTWYIWVVIIMLYIIQIIAWQNILSFHYLLYTLQIIAWQNIFELSLLCYTYYKSLHDIIYLSCHYYVIHNTNHCMTKYIWVVIIMLYILQIIAWQNIFELSLLCYAYYKSLHDMIYLSCHYYVIHNTNHCMTKYIWVFIICYTYYKSLHDKIYLIVIIMLCILQIIAWHDIFELSLLCYT